MDNNISQKKILILGGSCEIGCLLASKLISANNFPILTWKSKKGKERIGESLKENSHSSYDAFCLDFSDGESALHLLEEKIKNGVDALVDMAHSDYESFIADADNKVSQEYFQTNIAFRASAIKSVARIMLKQKHGRMIFMSSVAAVMPNIGQGFYAASKLASEALYQNVGLELGHKGITTISIRAGYVNAGRGKLYLKNIADINKQIPMRKTIEPNDIVDAIMFFLSSSSQQFNATSVTIDGGFSVAKQITVSVSKSKMSQGGEE
ncbi:MAG: SDR family NAD(P)-dependent oxidoreductase [Deltaproteobacteria bacterium]